MNQTLNEYLATSTVNIPIIGFIFNIILSAFLAASLGWVYIRYGEALSNRKQFSNNFMLLTTTTMLMITIVKSSLALSLRLVGALSIIRFRSAIKEPEELTYLFLSIAIGLGLGANQTAVTIIAFITITIIIILKKYFSQSLKESNNFHLSIQSLESKNIDTNKIIDILDKYCEMVDLRRLDETSDSLEISFFIEVKNISQINHIKETLHTLSNNIKITFLDNKGLI